MMGFTDLLVQQPDSRNQRRDVGAGSLDCAGGHRHWRLAEQLKDMSRNGCAERLIRTLKENLLWVRTVRTVEELRLTLIAFRRTYNESWLIERRGHRSPAQFRHDQMDTLPLAA